MDLIDKLKRCCTCKKNLPLSIFNRQTKAKDGLQGRCRSCAQGGEGAYCETRRQYRRDAMREKYKTPEGYRKHLNRYLKWTYKITLEEYEKLVRKQNNLCAICQSEPKEGKRLYVDHCHRTNEIRGLLCFHCNTALGHFKDNRNLLQAALHYLYEK